MKAADTGLGLWRGREGLLEETMTAIRPLDAGAVEAASDRAGRLAIPGGSLGRMLELAVRLAGIQGTLKPAFPRKAVAVMAGDHGVVGRGVSAFPPEVTPQMVAGFARGTAAINALATVAGARVLVADVGVAADLTPTVGVACVAEVAKALELGAVVHRKIRMGTDDLSAGPAMKRHEAIAAIEAGIDVVEGLRSVGLDLIGTGDMGIGNTTPSSALACVFTGHSPAKVTGRGTGVDDLALARKRRVVETALADNEPSAADPVGALAAVGGLEIGAIAGLVLGGAAAGIPVLIDGFISTAGALVACALAPGARDYLIAAHRSLEPGHRLMLEHLRVVPLLDLDLRLGEGTGAALAMPLVDGAASLLANMATFEEAGVSGSTSETRGDAGRAGASRRPREAGTP